MQGMELPGVRADVGAIIKTLNPTVLGKYIATLEAARNLLKNYLYELNQVESRLQKVSSASRTALGEAELQAKKLALQETLEKLEAHQSQSYRRLNG